MLSSSHIALNLIYDLQLRCINRGLIRFDTVEFKVISLVTFVLALLLSCSLSSPAIEIWMSFVLFSKSAIKPNRVSKADFCTVVCRLLCHMM